MKDRIIPIKNPALPFYHSDVKSKIKDTIEVTYNTNAFYIFCKNFEVIAAEIFKFEKIKTNIRTNIGTNIKNVYAVYQYCFKYTRRWV